MSGQSPFVKATSPLMSPHHPVHPEALISSSSFSLVMAEVLIREAPLGQDSSPWVGGRGQETHTG